MYLTLSAQFFYAYSVIRAQFEYNYHSDSSFSQFSSSATIVSIRASESATINQSIRIENQHARFVFLSAFFSNQHVRSASSFVISASIFRNSTSNDENYYESTQF
jgi:DNA-binding NarL/FixJ family response regulator